MPRKTKSDTPPKPRGRPSTYTQEIADEICERLAKGEPLAEICRFDNMPAVRTVSDWKASNAAFSADFARAREEGYDQIAADCLKIADETSNDTVYGENGERPNTEWISRSKLRIETRLKLLAKWDPKRYGEKLAIGGAADLPPVDTKATLDVAGLPTEVLAQIMKAKDATERS
ncbi:terminase [Massilia sp. ZL223]|uniref:terminase small subunit-like protein n=1 Tax=Massilia sp. ZL223 TaxID=2824904 RepID=UPI001B8217AA|nr:terminase [Massilia sp. ZL223]MBQ5963158.1 terminase [Massilia sp. ZL223]